MSRRRFWLLVSLSLSAVVALALVDLWLSHPFLDLSAPESSSIPGSSLEKALSSSSLPSVRLPTAAAHVTKSLAELGIPQQLSDHVVFFNRVPKAGSEMLVLLMQWLQGQNNFRHVRLGRNQKRRLNRLQQEELVDEVTHIVQQEAIPLSFDRHVYFVNFTAFDRQSPTFINLIRDPVEKAASRFYYSRVTPNPRNPDLKSARVQPYTTKSGISSFEDCVLLNDPECHFQSGLQYDLTIPYFCGHNKWCMVLNDPWALEMAKANVERYFSVVGILEDLNTTLAALEKKLPYFFRGVRQMYFKDLVEPHKNRNKSRPRELSPEVRKKLESVLEKEYDFYYFIRRRLYLQLTN